MGVNATLFVLALSLVVNLFIGIRAYPFNKNMVSPFDAGAIRWALRE